MVGKFCTQCGEPVGDVDRFCGSCRTSLTGETVASQRQTLEPVESKVTAVRSPFELVLAAVLGVAFFLPWFSYAGIFTIEGYRIPTLVRSIAQIGQSIEGKPTKETWADLYYLLWAIPLMAGLMGVLLLRGKNVKALQFGSGLLVASPFVYLFIKAPSDSLRGFSFGAYLEVVAGLVCIAIASGLLRPPQRGMRWRTADRVFLGSIALVLVAGVVSTVIAQERERQEFADQFEKFDSGSLTDSVAEDASTSSSSTTPEGETYSWGDEVGFNISEAAGMFQSELLSPTSTVEVPVDIWLFGLDNWTRQLTDGRWSVQQHLDQATASQLDAAITALIPAIVKYRECAAANNGPQKCSQEFGALAAAAKPVESLADELRIFSS